MLTAVHIGDRRGLARRVLPLDQRCELVVVDSTRAPRYSRSAMAAALDPTAVLEQPRPSLLIHSRDDRVALVESSLFPALNIRDLCAVLPTGAGHTGARGGVDRMATDFVLHH